MLTETRRRILKLAYQMEKERPDAPLFFSQNIMESLRLEEDEYTFDVRFLIGEGLLKVPSKVSTGRGWPLGVKITNEGIKLVESDLGEQETPGEIETPLRWKFLVEGKEIPLCFISYSGDNKLHKAWVRKLAKDLVKNGVQTILDQWDLQPGMDLPQFMETSIRQSDYVVLVCTPAFARKANAGVGGTGYEKSIIIGEIFTKGKEPGKFIPILRRGTRETAVPSYLKSKYYVDFTNDKEYSDKLEQLLRVIFQEPEDKRPALGTPPFLKNPVL